MMCVCTPNPSHTVNDFIERHAKCLRSFSLSAKDMRIISAPWKKANSESVLHDGHRASVTKISFHNLVLTHELELIARK